MRYLLILVLLLIHGCSHQDKIKQGISCPADTTCGAYHRKLYRHWVDADRDCQNTRAEVLILTSLVEPKFKTSKKCRVISGKWYDPYSATYIYDASKIDIDHILPLKAAHDLGARYFSKQEKRDFANDLENLLPVSAKLNRQKGAKNPVEWMPPNKAYHCEYVQRWQQIRKKYSLNLQQRKLASIKSLENTYCEN